VRITRRRFVLGACGLVGAPLVATAGYAAAEAQTLVVTRYALTPPSWPAGRRLSVTVIADLHAGGPNMGLGHIRRIVDVANGLGSDLVVLLGDYFATHLFVTERVPHPVWAGELARLAAPHGIWAIFGNNDWWHDIEGVRRALADVRIPVLENDAVLLGRSGNRFWLAGLGDQIAIKLGRGRFVGVDDLPATLARVTTDDPVLLLVHEPDIFPRVSSRVALTLAGHTHGGQIRVPLVWPVFVPSRYGRRFAYGHVREGDRHMIVSGGLGTSRIPARLGVPPEVVQIALGG
jgi:predicted MPP superfamily phosphohydrolase